MRELKFLFPYAIVTDFSYFVAKNGLLFSSPMIFMAIRYLLSGLIILAFARKLIINKDILILSIMTTMATIFWIVGLLYVSPAQSSVLSYSMPLFSLPLAFLIVKEKPDIKELAGITVGFAGVFVYGIPLFSGFTLLGFVLTVINAFFWAGFTVYYRKVRESDPLAVNATQFLFGSIFLFALSPFGFHLTFNVQFTADLLYMAIFAGAIAFVTWNFLIKTSSVNKVTVLAFSVPISTTIIESVLSSSIPTIYGISGIALMFLGIMISRLRRGIKVIPPGGQESTV